MKRTNVHWTRSREPCFCPLRFDGSGNDVDDGWVSCRNAHEWIKRQIHRLLTQVDMNDFITDYFRSGSYCLSFSLALLHTLSYCLWRSSSADTTLLSMSEATEMSLSLLYSVISYHIHHLRSLLVCFDNSIVNDLCNLGHTGNAIDVTAPEKIRNYSS